MFYDDKRSNLCEFGTMRSNRLLDDQRLSYYHCLSRVIERRFIFDEQGRERFRKMMRQQEAFSGVRVVTWTCLSNHFHVLVAVEEKDGEVARKVKQELMEDDAAFLKRLQYLYEPKALEEFDKLLKGLRCGTEMAGAKEKKIAKLKQPFLDRMFDLSCFVGEIKQRISQRYNLQNERKGPLWEERFKSVLIQGEPGLLEMVAAYIDLNAVRAGIVKEPKEWRWCGYAEAAAAQSVAREGLYEAMGEPDGASRDGVGWKRVHKKYREVLMVEAIQRRDEEGRVVRKGLTPEEFEAEEERGFELPDRALLRHRIRYFTDGLALGGAEFIEGVFRKKKRSMGVRRKVGPRVPKMEGLGGLTTLKDLRGFGGD
jgi:REP element-mobilizing transposase RayT